MLVQAYALHSHLCCVCLRSTLTENLHTSASSRPAHSLTHLCCVYMCVCAQRIDQERDGGRDMRTHQAHLEDQIKDALLRNQQYEGGVYGLPQVCLCVCICACVCMHVLCECL
jgi:hypothetical protein